MEQHSTVFHIPPGLGNEKKPVELHLAWYINDYKVVAITNSTVLKPGMWLAPGLVQNLCQFENWTIKMADNEVISALFGLGASAVSAGVKL